MDEEWYGRTPQEEAEKLVSKSVIAIVVTMFLCSLMLAVAIAIRKSK
jgi:hypothetical protein